MRGLRTIQRKLTATSVRDNLPKRPTEGYGILVAPIVVASHTTREARTTTPTVRKNVTWVQPEPTTSDVTGPQQLGPDTTWAEPSIVKSKLARGSPGVSTTRDQTKD
jgi:hypothetical protein